MTTAAEIAAYADELLQTRGVPDYPNALNGLQVATDSPIRSLAAAVDFSSRSVSGAMAAGANLLLVHHGAFWAGAQPLTGSRYKIFRSLFANGIGVYSSHLPLDCHSSLGNNVLLAKALGLEPDSGFGRFKDILIGLSGETSVGAEDLMARVSNFAAGHGGGVHHTPFPEKKIFRRWAICSGGGASAETLQEAAAKNVDVLIVGEGPHWTAVDAEESGLVIIFAGHYATETLGVQALAQTLGSHFKIPWSFVPTPTGT